MIDINGPQKPNQYGYDTFFFEMADYIANDQIIPHGGTGAHDCKRKDTNKQGTGCAWWVLNKENTKYRCCDDPTLPTCK